MRNLRTLPKAHLHLHLDGAIREQTLRTICEQQGIPMPQLPVGKTFASFDAFMEAIRASHEALSSPDNLHRIVGEVVEDAAADGAVWVEVSMWPGLFGGRLGPDREALLLVLDAGIATASHLGVGFGLMVAANRHMGSEEAVEMARLAVSMAPEGVVSFGLDGDEAAFPPAPFAEAFAIARHGGLLATPHAGELLGPQSVAEALDILQADRILHGVRAVDDPALVARLASTSVCLDVCPTSNSKLSVFSLEANPLPALLRAGVKCSVNADDPLLFGSSLLQEYELCRTDLFLSDDEMAQIAATSIDSSGAPDQRKVAEIDGIARWLVDATETEPGIQVP